MPDYQNAKIYKIVCNNTGKQYIGSTTTNYLCNRLAQHRRDYIKGVNITSKEIIEGGNYSMVLVENCPCNSKDELHKRERHYIETLECVNKFIPGRTAEELYNLNKIYKKNNNEKVREISRLYYEKNREKIIEKAKEKHNCECGGKYMYANKTRHLKTKKHLDYLGNN
tara:strand:+ start:581 stop:1084 length:504 start_codon:yes stop_codon:yes gene_type:complete